MVELPLNLIFNFCFNVISFGTRALRQRLQPSSRAADTGGERGAL